MATASKGDVTTLHLSNDEAETLCCVLRKVGGSPSGRRGFTEGIYQALRTSGYDKAYNSLKGFEMSGSLVFPNFYSKTPKMEDKNGDSK